MPLIPSLRTASYASALLVALAATSARAQEPACGASRGPVPHPLPKSLLLSPADSARLSSMENQLWNGRMSGPYPRNIVQVIFRPGTSHDAIQSAVDRVCGEVVGPGFGGMLVRVHTEGSAAALWAAVDALAALPQVQHAAPDLFVLVPFPPFTTFGARAG